MTWFNMKHYLLLSFLTFKFLDWSRATSLPLWDLLSYILVLGASYWLGFVTYRYLKRYNLAFQVASYKKAIVITGIVLIIFLIYTISVLFYSKK